MTDPGYEQFPKGDTGDGEQAPTEGQPASPPPNQAAPGPHPHEAADLGNAMGDIARKADPMEGYREGDEVEGSNG